MARAIWSGVISFGMVSIPVKLYTATSSKSISFHQLHEKCKTRIRELRWCPHCDKEVSYEDIVKGYEYSKGNYVVVSEDDMEKLPLPTKNAIIVNAFVKEEEIDPIYFNGSYYLEPEKSAARPFALLLESLEEKEMIGVASLALRNKERLCAMRPLGGLLLVEMLLYPDEIRVDLDTAKPKVKVSKEEMKMASTLIDLMSKEFDPEDYKDHYREAMEKLIDAKLNGEEIVESPEPRETRVVDLMDALRASVESARSGKSGTSMNKRAAAETEEEGEEGEEKEAKPKRRRTARSTSTAKRSTAQNKVSPRKRRGAA